MARSKTRRAVRGIAVLGFTLCLFLGLGVANAQEESEDKQIRVVSGEGKKGLEVEIEALRSSYAVDEPIRFRVRGNQTFFLYLFNIDDDDDEGVLILPNRLDSGNKYPGGRSYTAPNPGVEFVADRPGTERVLMVASTRYLDLKTADYDRRGDFWVSSAKGLEAQLKGIRVRPREPEVDEDVIVKEISVRVRGEGYVDYPREADTDAQVFVSADRTVYRVGDRVRVLYGANTPGWVHLYTRDPRGREQLLKARRVSGDQIHTLEAVAEKPKGSHALVIRYSEEKDLEIGKEAGGSGEKGLRLVDDGEGTTAIYRFEIK
jgi:hypothetical protein